jgi:3-methyladenine DNA glycosylase AlkD
MLKVSAGECMKDTIAEIRSDLSKNADRQTLESFHRFFKEDVKFYGVKSGIVNRIARERWKEVKDKSKKGVFDLAEQLYRNGYCEEAFIAADWIPRLADRFERTDIKVFKRWIDQYLDNWAKIDSFCNHTMGDFLMKYPNSADEIITWTGSANRWMRRAAAVSFIVPAKKGLFMKEAFRIADILLEDKDDLVQKGYGWLLKEESRLHQKEVLDYVLKNKARMPRTALRYAIELMPKELKAQAMK